MAYEHLLRVRFQDADPAGIAFFGRLFEYAHEAFEEYLRSVGAPLEDLVRRGEGAPLVHAEADFSRPLRHGQLIRVRLQVAKLSERSVRMESEMLDEAGTLLARVALVHAGIDFKTGQGAPLPAALRKALQRLIG